MITNSLRLMPALPFALAFAAGIAMGYSISSHHYQWLLLAISGVLCLASCFLKNRSLRTGFLCMASAVLGVIMMDMQKTRIHADTPDGQVQMTGIVIEPPHDAERYISTDIYVTDGYLKGLKLRCYIYNNGIGAAPLLGATYNLKGKLRHFGNDSADSNFNYKKWADSHSLTAQLTVYGDNIIPTNDAMDSMPFMERVAVKAKMLRAELLESLHDKGLTGTSYAIVAAMAFGDRSMLTQDTRDEYSRTGVAHLLALSGMHLGVLFMMLMMVFGRLRNKLLRCVIIVVTVWAYVILVGMPSSVVRAATMLTIYSLVAVSGRDSMSVNALFVTFAIMLACNPMMIWDVGFQLSFLAVMSIFIFFPPIYNIMSERLLFDHPVLRFLWSTIALSIAAQIGTSPLSVYYFGRFPLIFLLTNIVAIPLVTLLLYSTFLLLLFSVIPAVGSLMMFCLKACTSLLSTVIGAIASWEWATIENISINWIQMLLIYAIMAVLTYILVLFPNTRSHHPEHP